MQGYEAHIAEWRTCASEDDVREGTLWYPLARDTARLLAEKYGVSIEVAAGVIAVLSPRVEWTENLDSAEAILSAFHNGDTSPPLEVIATHSNIRKAWNICQYGDDFPRCDGTRVGSYGGRVKCSPGKHECHARNYLHGPKVHEFFETILGKLEGRVVDVWATRAADVSPYDVLTLAPTDPRRVGDPGSRFSELQNAYEFVAAHFSEPAAVTQAIVWVCIRRTWKSGRATQTAIPF